MYLGHALPPSIGSTESRIEKARQSSWFSSSARSDGPQMRPHRVSRSVANLPHDQSFEGAAWLWPKASPGDAHPGRGFSGQRGIDEPWHSGRTCTHGDTAQGEGDLLVGVTGLMAVSVWAEISSTQSVVAISVAPALTAARSG
jgi:hypothetical protein